MKVTYIGGGNMAAALISGWIKAGRSAQDIAVLEVNPERRAQLAQELSVATHAEPAPALSGAELVVLAVKPQQMQEVCLAVQPFIAQATVLSIAAGIRMRELTRWLGTDRVVRAMPNTPALIGAGISGAVAAPSVAADARAASQAVLEAAGAVVWLNEEEQLDAVTALSGSGPAYVFFFMEALISAGQSLGLGPQVARELVVHTVLGAGTLAAQSSEPLSMLRERVTSKGGTTAAALDSLTQDHVREAWVRAVFAAQRRAVELGDAFSQT